MADHVNILKKKKKKKSRRINVLGQDLKSLPSRSYAENMISLNVFSIHILQILQTFLFVAANKPALLCSPVFDSLQCDARGFVAE